MVIFFNDQNSLHINVGFGSGSNNFAELMALCLLLTKAWEWGIQSMQIFGDSKPILEWAKGTWPRQTTANHSSNEATHHVPQARPDNAHRTTGRLSFPSRRASPPSKCKPSPYFLQRPSCIMTAPPSFCLVSRRRSQRRLSDMSMAVRLVRPTTSRTHVHEPWSSP